VSITSTKITKGVLIRESDTLTPKELEITPGGTPGTKTSLVSSQTTDKTLILPNGNDTLVGNVTPAIITSKSIDAEQNTIVNISNTNIKNGANIAVNKLAALTTSRAVQTNASTGAIEPSSVTNTELGYVSGATSNIQTQITTNASNAASALSAHTGASSSVHGVSGAVVGTTDSQTVTNKTIVVANNTITTAASGNLTSTNLNAALAELQTDIDTRDKIVDVNDKVNTSSINDRIYADGVVDNHQNTVDGIHGIAGSVVGTFDDQVLTNKDIDGGTASNTSRITLPKNTKTNLDALTRKAGTIVFDTTSNRPYYDNGTVLSLVGSGSGGSGVNYISSNPDAETDTSGWATYSNTPGTAPVTGTGGTPNSTFTRTTSSPLRGSASFLYTHNSGASRQGEGASFSFTIDSADKAKVLNINFDYVVASGTFVAGTASTDSDLTVWIYDVTNAVIIQPSSYKLLSNSTTTPDKFTATFQTSSNSTSYRLIIHNGTTVTSAFTLKFDNFNVGPSNYIFGSPVSDPISYTPTIGGFGTVTGLSAQYYRDGKYLIGQVQFTSGTNSGANATIGLPSGLSIDNSIIGAASQVGVFGATATPFNGNMYAATGSSLTSIYLSSNSGSYQNGALGTTWANTTTISCNFRVPILGWASSVQMSDQTDTRIVAARGVDPSGQSIPSGTVTIVNFSTTSFDSHGAITTGASWKYTAQVSGYYRVSSLINYVANTGGGSLLVYIYKNGSQVSSNYTLWTATAAPYCANINDIVYLSTGDYIDIRTLQNAGANRPLAANGSYVSIDRISGPASIAANETISLRYENVAGTTVTSSYSNIPFVTKTKDTHGTFLINVFTCNSPGEYDIKWGFGFVGQTLTTSQSISQRVMKNGSTVVAQATQFGTGAAGLAYNGTNGTSINLIAGDTISLQMAVSVSTNLDTTSGLNWISIKKTGN
jgi:hypothetical protein